MKSRHYEECPAFEGDVYPCMCRELDEDYRWLAAEAEVDRLLEERIPW